jgi:aldose 1-epimerase
MSIRLRRSRAFAARLASPWVLSAAALAMLAAGCAEKSGDTDSGSGHNESHSDDDHGDHDHGDHDHGDDGHGDDGHGDDGHGGDDSHDNESHEEAVPASAGAGTSGEHAADDHGADDHGAASTPAGGATADHGAESAPSDGTPPTASSLVAPAGTEAPPASIPATPIVPVDPPMTVSQTLTLEEPSPAAPATTAETTMSVTKSSFGQTSDGQQVDKFVCTNANGLSMELITYGAIMTRFMAPDRDGKFANVNLSCPDMPGYEACGSYFGATVGRYCNRIAFGKFELDGATYQLAINNNEHHLHGGLVGFNRKIWNAETVETASAVGVKFTLVSPDNDESYPGTLTATATYLLDNRNRLSMEFTATTDKATVVNLTNHNYWNLAGEGSGTILGHELKLACPTYLAVDAGLIPTGEQIPVGGTPFDFTEFHAIGERIEAVGGDPIGYDHCYVIGGDADADGMRLAATVHDPATGREMEIRTTQPGIQFYSGNFLDGTPGSGGFAQHNAFCLETQHYPDSPNHPEFPSTVLRPGETYRQATVHTFQVRK